MEKIKVLIVAASLKVGGAEKVARDISLYAPTGKYEVHYLLFGDVVGDYEPMVIRKGCTVFHWPEPSENYLKFFKNLLRLMKEQQYYVVHAHNMFNCGFTMLAASIAGTPVRISHAHSALNTAPGLVKGIYEKVMQFLILRCSTDYIACGVAAGQRLFSKKTCQREVKLILNGIDIREFVFNSQKREAIRYQLEIQKHFVLGHVGHLTEVKNQAFLLDLMPLILKKRPETMLLMLGEGEDRAMLEQKARDMQLEDHVIMTGNVSNVADYLSAMDVFVFPSLYEGLPLSILEVQANGLPCVISDSVPEDVFVTDLLHPVSLKAPKEQWIEAILNAQRRNSDTYNRLLQQSDYTVEKAMAKIYRVYEKGMTND